MFGGYSMNSHKRKWLTIIMISTAVIWSALVTGFFEDVEILILPALIVIWLFIILQWTRR
ncbi:hypothetical protein SAMN05192551_101653 [Tindallia magadiensis]|uniref:Uncharacterized protein n=2 Tax=Tindallia magadiensis TaxID=69895 RepID=A0A1I3B8J6_9FIRM|nr:hypothetical protein SAMN05192551_101653 [Tindallia magadiensis]